MTTTLRRHGAHFSLAALTALAWPAAQAVELGDRIDVHGYGYGYQDYVQASANTYSAQTRKAAGTTTFSDS